MTRDFEAALCEYTSAPFAVAVNSCTAALMLACAWHLRDANNRRRADEQAPWEVPTVSIPRRTYVSVPQSIIHAGGRVAFHDEEWTGAYQLKPYPIWDSARRFTGGMYRDFGRKSTVEGDNERFIDTPGSGQFVCLSFHAAKILGDTQGGAILHDDPAADAWFRRARFDGRREGVAPKDDAFDMIGWHCYISPDVSARLLFKLSVLPKVNADLPNDPYPDLSTFEVFR